MNRHPSASSAIGRREHQAEDRGQGASNRPRVKFFPGAKNFANCPSLGNAAVRTMRRIAIKNFSKRSKTIGIDRSCKRLKKRERGGAILVHAVVRQREWTQQPPPNQALMVDGITLTRAAGIDASIAALTGRKASQTERS